MLDTQCASGAAGVPLVPAMAGGTIKPGGLETSQPLAGAGSLGPPLARGLSRLLTAAAPTSTRGQSRLACAGGSRRAAGGPEKGPCGHRTQSPASAEEAGGTKCFHPLRGSAATQSPVALVSAASSGQESDLPSSWPQCHDLALPGFAAVPVVPEACASWCHSGGGSLLGMFISGNTSAALLDPGRPPRSQRPDKDTSFSKSPSAPAQAQAGRFSLRHGVSDTVTKKKPQRPWGKK